MSDDAPGPLSAGAPEPAVTAEEVSGRSFPTAFRGFDPVEVRTFLGQVADELHAAARREAELRAALAEVAKRKRAAQAQLDQIRAGRDRLLDTLRVARRSIDEVTMRFEAADPTGMPPRAAAAPPPPVAPALRRVSGETSISTNPIGP